MLHRPDHLPRSHCQGTKLACCLVLAGVAALGADSRQAGTSLDTGARALAAAAKAGAAEHAPGVLSSAQRKLGQARALQSRGREREALRMAAQAALDARLAQAIAQSASAQMAAAQAAAQGLVAAADQRDDEAAPPGGAARAVLTTARPVATR